MPHINTKMLSGFLVVLKPRMSPNSGQLYAGVGRVPPYDEAAEDLAMDEYVFGGVKDPDTNVIPSLEAAVRLCKLLSRGGRQCEIIYCRNGEQPLHDPELEIGAANSLGYDIATIRTECWSIVDDISLKDWAIPYRRQINSNGLFSSRIHAESYFRDYREYKDWDWDFLFDLVEVIQIKLR